MSNQVVRAVEKAGVVGAGGGGFPAHVKAAARAETLIANYAECEPLVASDSAIIATEPELVIRGLSHMQEATGAENVIIATKAKRKGQNEILERLMKKQGRFSLHFLDDVYPAGDEHVLVEEVTGRAVPQAGIPIQISVVVSNVSTLWRVALALEGKAYTERFVTVAGEVKRPSTLMVAVGTPISRVIEACGGPTSASHAIIRGGPMMGEFIVDERAPVKKCTTAIIVLPKDNVLVQKRTIGISVAVRKAMASCMQCMDCTFLCPRYLLGHQLFPHRTMRSVAFWVKGLPHEMASATLCCECGLCGIFVCPMDLSPVAVYQKIKSEFGRMDLRPRVSADAVPPRPERHGRHIPLDRLVNRLGLAKYEAGLPVKRELLETGQVRIPLVEKWGRLRPIVRVGETVRVGSMVAEPLGPGPGAPSHSGIEGKVTSLADDYVCIEG